MTTLLNEPRPAGVAGGRLRLGSGEIAYWNRPGEGAPLVLLHGNSASKAVFAGLFASPALAGRRLVAMDFPGCGESTDAGDPQATYTIPGLARAVGETLEALDLEPCILVGWSLGGHVAIEVAGQGRPLAALVLTGAPPSGPGAEEVLQSFHQNEVMNVTFTETPTPEELKAYVGQVYGPARPIPEGFFAAARRCDGRLRRRFAEHWLTAQEGFHQRSVIANWPNPIAVIQGADEPFFDPTLIDRLAWANLWRGASQMIPGSGHAPHVDSPEAYAALLADFLREARL